MGQLRPKLFPVTAMDEQLVPAQVSNSGRYGVKSLVVAFMCGMAVMGTIGAGVKAATAADTPLQMPAFQIPPGAVQVHSSAGAGAMGGLVPMLLSVGIMVLVCYMVN